MQRRHSLQSLLDAYQEENEWENDSTDSILFKEAQNQNQASLEENPKEEKHADLSLPVDESLASLLGNSSEEQPSSQPESPQSTSSDLIESGSNSSIDSLDSSLYSLQSELDARADMQEEIDDLTGEIANLDLDIHMFKDELKEAEIEQQKAQRTIHTQKAQLKDLNKKNNDLTSELKNTEAALKESQAMLVETLKLLEAATASNKIISESMASPEDDLDDELDLPPLDDLDYEPQIEATPLVTNNQNNGLGFFSKGRAVAAGLTAGIVYWNRR